ncbi:hypothetical protein IJ732_01620 [bacterium]|nr:hypothetical protein [bacterium]
MPGITGFIKTNSNFNIDNMTNSMMNFDKLVKGDTFSDDKVIISEVKLDFCKNKFLDKDDLIIFVNGNCFNITEINQQFKLNASVIEEIFYEAYKNNILDSVLKNINGFFEAVIYDKNNSKISLISDRRGTHFLFYYIKDNHFAFAGEAKSIVSLKDIDLTINKNSFNCFMELGYLLQDATWFENIKLIKPSSIFEYNINTGEYSQRYYWKFSEIKPSQITYDEAVNKLAKLLPNAVKKMYFKDDILLVPLSGGLDSRMIAVSLYEQNHNTEQNFVTFGEKGCRDIEISSLIAKKMKQTHRTYSITNENVVVDRKNDIWYIDGLHSIQHTHGFNTAKYFPKETTTYFTGIVGGEIYGAVYRPDDEYVDKLPSKEMFKNIFKNQINLLNINDDYYNLHSYYPIILDNAIRKFSLVSMSYTFTHHDVMFPFLDNDLLDFILSVPDEYKKDYKLYFDALKKAFPYWYTKIPFQSADGFNPETWLQKRKRKFMTKIRKIFKIHEQGHYFDYAKYIQNPDTQLEMDKILSSKNNFISAQGDDFISKYKNENWENIRFNPDLALKLITVKLYFDKIEEILK